MHFLSPISLILIYLPSTTSVIFDSTPSLDITVRKNTPPQLFLLSAPGYKGPSGSYEITPIVPQDAVSALTISPSSVAYDPSASPAKFYFSAALNAAPVIKVPFQVSDEKGVKMNKITITVTVLPPPPSSAASLAQAGCDFSKVVVSPLPGPVAPGGFADFSLTWRCGFAGSVLQLVDTSGAFEFQCDGAGERPPAASQVLALESAGDQGGVLQTRFSARVKEPGREAGAVWAFIHGPEAKYMHPPGLPARSETGKNKMSIRTYEVNEVYEIGEQMAFRLVLGSPLEQEENLSFVISGADGARLDDLPVKVRKGAFRSAKIQYQISADMFKGKTAVRMSVDSASIAQGGIEPPEPVGVTFVEPQISFSFEPSNSFIEKGQTKDVTVKITGVSEEAKFKEGDSLVFENTYKKCITVTRKGSQESLEQLSLAPRSFSGDQVQLSISALACDSEREYFKLRMYTTGGNDRLFGSSNPEHPMATNVFIRPLAPLTVTVSLKEPSTDLGVGRIKMVKISLSRYFVDGLDNEPGHSGDGVLRLQFEDSNKLLDFGAARTVEINGDSVSLRFPVTTLLGASPGPTEIRMSHNLNEKNKVTNTIPVINVVPQALSVELDYPTQAEVGEKWEVTASLSGCPASLKGATLTLKASSKGPEVRIDNGTAVLKSPCDGSFSEPFSVTALAPGQAVISFTASGAEIEDIGDISVPVLDAAAYASHPMAKPLQQKVSVSLSAPAQVKAGATLKVSAALSACPVLPSSTTPGAAKNPLQLKLGELPEGVKAVDGKDVITLKEPCNKEFSSDFELVVQDVTRGTVSVPVVHAGGAGGDQLGAIAPLSLNVVPDRLVEVKFDPPLQKVDCSAASQVNLVKLSEALEEEVTVTPSSQYAVFNPTNLTFEKGETSKQIEIRAKNAGDIAQSAGGASDESKTNGTVTFKLSKKQIGKLDLKADDASFLFHCSSTPKPAPMPDPEPKPESKPKPKPKPKPDSKVKKVKDTGTTWLSLTTIGGLAIALAFVGAVIWMRGEVKKRDEAVLGVDKKEGGEEKQYF